MAGPSPALRNAQLQGAASGVVGKLRRPPSPEVERVCRRMWPDLFERLDALVELVDARDDGWAERGGPTTAP
jgi:hypothetical protein